MSLRNNVIRARHEIATFIILLSVLPAFWFTINNDPTHGFSLCQQFRRGKELIRLKGIAYRATTALKRLGVIATSSATTSNSNSINALLKEIKEYVENSNKLVDEDEDGNENDNNSGSQR